MEEKIDERKKNIIIFLNHNKYQVICLIYFAIPYLTHNTTIASPNAMLPVESWDRAGMILTFGFIPLLVTNILTFIFVNAKAKVCKISIFFSERNVFNHSDKLLDKIFGVEVKILIWLIPRIGKALNQSYTYITKGYDTWFIHSIAFYSPYFLLLSVTPNI